MALAYTLQCVELLPTLGTRYRFLKSKEGQTPPQKGGNLKLSIGIKKPVRKTGFQKYRWGDSNSQALRH